MAGMWGGKKFRATGRGAYIEEHRHLVLNVKMYIKKKPMQKMIERNNTIPCFAHLMCNRVLFFQEFV